ncbi:protein ABHD11-like [Uloborus diversus]|uniref:protein ABHD11-like n=1 Tax=Uloborus diversus TaxID=327109 RepID=UPI0024094326|nr:protein ABHD11-like [Uloborus diversus]
MIMHSVFISILLIAIQQAGAVPVKNPKIPPVDLAYECVQKAGNTTSKAPILLLHGMGAMKSDWDGTYEVLAFKSGRRVCRADLRNHGDSPWDDETSVAAMTEDVIHLLDTIEEKTAVIIGHSLGGKIAMHTAITYPERVDSIVAEDMVPNMNSDNVQLLTNFLKMLLAIMEKVPEGSDEEQATEILTSMFREILKQINMTVSEDQMRDGVLPLTCTGGKCRWKTNFKAFLNTIEKDFSSFWTETTGVSDAPALFIYGTASEVKVYEYLEDIRKQFPKVKFVGVEGAGHSIHRVFPQFEDEVLKFLEETNFFL